MPFTVGVLSGAALTTLTLSLTLSAHHRTRTHQSALLRQQSALLNNIIDPPPEQPIIRERVSKADIAEVAKDRWNREVESLVRRVEGADWGGIGERGEWIVRALGRRVSEGVKGLGGKE
ncbi:MAG: hypothetical protein M1828_007311 [Chrysothrix sp. TS-e1954]|nr:MAG: hypothetical protein M1828_007311 [Chrysothrix sp. TS-e1954]